MNKTNSNIEEKGFGLVTIPSNSDARGSLAFAEWKHLPFEPQRIFWIYDVKDGKTRGGHAHTKCAEVVFCVNGSFDMFVDNGKESGVFHMENPNEGIYIGANVWCELRNFTPGTTCVVVASEPYEAQGYIHSKDDYNRLFGK